MQAEGLRGEAYEACLPVVRERLEGRMKWVWTEEIDEVYESERGRMGL